MSNQEFTELEYSKWIDASAAAGIPMPNRENIQQKQNDIKEALHYEFNEQDIERIVSKQTIHWSFFNLTIICFSVFRSEKKNVSSQLRTILP